MKPRDAEIAAFLAEAGWADAADTPLQADFSTRRFTRLQLPGKRAVLMDAEAGQNTVSFVVLARLLRLLDISAPEIYAEAADEGLVLMEDFGNRNIGRTLDSSPDAKPFYRNAVDVLVHLHKAFDPSKAQALDLPIFSGALFASQVELFIDAYFPFAKKREATIEEAEAFRAAWKQALKGIANLPQTLMLRDFMPDNLMQLDRPGWHGIGLLDFQDGGIGPMPYDLASLCEVVRRDGGDGMLDDLIDYYHAQAAPALSKAELRSACRILAAQRHMRILGIIARLAMKGRKEKLIYVPRIWKYLEQLLQDEKLEAVRGWVKTSAF